MRFMSAAFLLALAGSQARTADSPGFDVQPGAALTKRFRTSAEIVLTGAVMREGDVETDMTRLYEYQALGAYFRGELDCMDEYSSVAGGRPLVFSRTFEKIQARAGLDYFLQSRRWEFDGWRLEGQTARFAWNEAGGDYERAWLAGQGDGAALEWMSPDLDLLALLPERPMTSGTRWKVEARPLWGLMIPGVDLARLGKPFYRADEIEDLSKELLVALQKLVLRGEATCEWRSTPSVDGRSQAGIALRCRIDEDLELDPGTLGRDASSAWRFDDVRARLRAVLDADCLWDLERGHFTSLELFTVGKLRLEFDVWDLARDSDGLPWSFAMDFDLRLEQIADCR
jgi:hypothetical protein